MMMEIDNLTDTTSYIVKHIIGHIYGCNESLQDVYLLSNILTVICDYNDLDIINKHRYTSDTGYNHHFMYIVHPNYAQDDIASHLLLHANPERNYVMFELLLHVPVDRVTIQPTLFPTDYRVNNKSLYEIYQFVTTALQADFGDSKCLIL